MDIPCKMLVIQVPRGNRKGFVIGTGDRLEKGLLMVHVKGSGDEPVGSSPIMVGLGGERN